MPDPPLLRKKAWSSLVIQDFACGPRIEEGGNFAKTIESQR